MSIMPPEYNFVIDHPVQTGWLTHGREIFDSRHTSLITERFQESGENIKQLLGAMALAGAKVDEKRMRYESHSRHELRLTEGERFHAYTELAGRPERVGQFISWFGVVAQEYFRLPDTSRTIGKIGLELGGMRQAGDWSGTGPLDDMAKQIPPTLNELHSGLSVRIFERGKAAQKNYVIEPLDFVKEGTYTSQFGYAMVRRRRAVADISLPGKPALEIFKESSALVVINQMEEKDISLIRESYRDYANFEANGLKNSRPAGVVGREFERAIREEEREHSLTIIPVSAHYVMVMDRPGQPADAA